MINDTHLEQDATIHKFPQKRLETLGDFMKPEARAVVSEASADWTVLAEIFKRSVLRDPEVRNNFASKISSPVRQDSLLNIGVNPAWESHFPQLKKLFNEAGVESTSLAKRSYGFSSADIAPDLRFRIARDLKLLSLMAYLRENVSTIKLDSKNTYHDDHLTIVAAPNCEAQVLAMCDTSRWEYRRELGNRAYLVSIDGQLVVMKEQKTDQHPLGGKTYLPKTAEQEFQTGMLYQSLGQVETDEVRIEWEKPLGYVKLGKDYAFTLWQYEAHSTTPSNAIEEYVQDRLKSSNPKYRGGYLDTKKLAKKLFRKMPIWYNHPPLLSPNFTFEDFLRVKASIITLDAQNRVYDLELDSGTIEDDISNNQLLYDRQTNKFVLFNYDFEYNYPIDEARKAEIRQSTEDYRIKELNDGNGDVMLLTNRPRDGKGWDVCFYALKAKSGEWTPKTK